MHFFNLESRPIAELDVGNQLIGGLNVRFEQSLVVTVLFTAVGKEGDAWPLLGEADS